MGLVMSARRCISIFLFCGLATSSLFLATPEVFARPDNAFDLTGPKIEVQVTRSGKKLGIADVPNLQGGDRVWIHVDLPEDQSVHYLLVAAFLRGTTNPPPENWFTRAETWNRQVIAEGVTVTVPAEAQQAVLFLAPETGGDFSSLRSAVRSKPGAFVRAVQDLNLASLDRTRSDRYLANIRSSADLEPKALHDRSLVLARTLGIRVDQQCFDRPPELQSTCLIQNSDQLVLDDGHTESMVAALTSGPSSDLMGAISATAIAGGGTFSPYVGAVVDMARILGNLHTAAYQYIPALALPKGAALNLRLNNPPSFRNPKSVLVVALPAVEAVQTPPLRAVNPDGILCLQKSPMVLPVDGAPLAYSTDIGHDFALRIKARGGNNLELPATADAERGGFVVNTGALQNASLETDVTAVLHGYWGFDAFEGPAFHLRNSRAAAWTIKPEDRDALILGRSDTIHVLSDSAVCASSVTVQNEQHKELKTTWSATKPGELEIQVPLQAETSGALKLTVKQYGLPAADR